MGAGRHGPIHTSNHRIRDPTWSRRWLGALPDVQAGDPRCRSAEISQFRSRSAVSVSSMASNLRILDVTEIKTVPYIPWSHPFVERLIGTIRRECLDRLLFWTATDLEMKLIAFSDYYNGYRSHAALKGETPMQTAESRAASFQSYRWRPHCRGLYQTPTAA